ncbi:MAG: hypothetical protein ACRCUH_15180 [Shewanella sp.]
MKENNGNAATDLLNKIGVQGEEQTPKAIPCGFKEPISEGKTITCGSIYRGRQFMCRDCMTQMLENAHVITNSMAEVMLVAVSDHDIEERVSDSTIDAMRNLLVNIGCIQPDKK